MPRKLPHSHTCFVCGESNPKALNVRFYADEHGAYVPLVLREEQMGYPGIAHGGALMSILDELMGWAATMQTGEFSVSAEINTRFLKPVPLHTPLTARAQMTQRRGRVWYTHGEIADEKGTVYVRATGKYLHRQGTHCGDIEVDDTRSGCTLAGRAAAPFSLHGVKAVAGNTRKE
jgi:uncharacterized protein (TIGR00369 family)